MSTLVRLHRTALFFTIVSAVLLSGCMPTTSELVPNESESLRTFLVEDVRVEIGVGSPIPVEIVIAGTWPDLCAQLASFEQNFDGSNFEVELLGTPVDKSCPPDLLGLPLRLAIPINAVELEEGTYNVTVNGVGTQFSVPLETTLQ